jgi:hypothetical protein
MSTFFKPRARYFRMNRISQATAGIQGMLGFGPNKRSEENGLQDDRWWGRKGARGE